MGLGLAHADVLNTVSPTHAREILTPEYGYGLESVLRARRSRLFGILNGLDVEAWDPKRDPRLAARFDAAHLLKRAANKLALQQEVGLPPRPAAPLVGIVSRLDTQKGCDIAVPALRRLAGDAQLVVLGTGLPQLEAGFKTLGREFPDRARIALRFDAALAARIYAGADVLLVPSRYEPCGLTQMIAMRYGAVPVVRRTGGLADTVTDYRVAKRGTGFVFRDYNSSALLKALRRALTVYRHSGQWQALQARGMRHAAAHFSWSRSAKEYVALYQKALAYRQSA
jgi:starch synthase